MPPAAARARLGWPVHRRVVLWVGEPRREKRLDLVEATFARLRGRHPDLDLRPVSRAPRQHVMWAMNASDVFLFPSDVEGSPVVVKEAMACNLPVVATEVGDLPELFRGVRGCRLSGAAPDQLAARVEALLVDGSRSAGREAVRHLSTAAEARRIIALYEEVLAPRPRRARVAAIMRSNRAP